MLKVGFGREEVFRRLSSDTFLTAHWKNLVMLNYSVEPSLLLPFIPAGTRIDTFEGKSYVSLIGFEFQRTRLRGVRVPFHQSFEEINLRFYVSYSGKRGAVFIRELVPKRAVALIARFAFNENYSYAAMSHRIEMRANGDVSRAEYSWRFGGQSFSMEIETEELSYVPPEGSLSQFITEHYWGYAAQRDGGCVEYAVKHPSWRVWDAAHVRFQGDSNDLYGREMSHVLSGTPDSAFFVDGSPVTVSRGRRIR
jgi:uncharacterized protein YqjF (DUF2071 family)